MSEHLMRVYDCEEDMQKLLDYIFGHDISLCLGLMEETEKVLSAESFRRVIKQVLGEDYDFLYIETAHYSFGQVYYVDIIHTKKHYSVGCIYGCPSQAYLLGRQLGIAADLLLCDLQRKSVSSESESCVGLQSGPNLLWSVGG